MNSKSPKLAKAGVALAVAAGGAKIWEYLTTSQHDRAVKEAYKNLSRAAAEDTTVYADHISNSPSPHGTVDGISGVPDLVVKSASQNSLLVEVETAASIETNPTRVTNQLAGFRKQGYRRVIAVPASDSKSEIVAEWIDTAKQELDGELVAARSDGVHTLL